MQLALSPEDQAFREEMRTFFTTVVPEEIRTKVLEGHELSKEEIAGSMKLLDDHDLAVPHWPEEWGGRGWNDLQRHLYLEEMQAAGCPVPARR